jgi:hypothetical protein
MHYFKVGLAVLALATVACAPKSSEEGGGTGTGSGSDSGSEADPCDGDSQMEMEFWFEDDDWPFELEDGIELRVIDSVCELSRVEDVGQAQGFRFDCEDPEGTPRSMTGRFILMEQLVAWLDARSTVGLRVVHLDLAEAPTWFSVRDPGTDELGGFGIWGRELLLPPHTDGFSEPVSLALSDTKCPVKETDCGTFQRLVVDFGVSGRTLTLGSDMRTSFEGYDFELVAEEENISPGVPDWCGDGPGPVAGGVRRWFGVFVNREP